MIIGNQKLHSAHFLNFLPLGFMAFPNTQSGVLSNKPNTEPLQFSLYYLPGNPAKQQPMQIIAVAWLIGFAAIPPPLPQMRNQPVRNARAIFSIAFEFAAQRSLFVNKAVNKNRKQQREDRKGHVGAQSQGRSQAHRDHAQIHWMPNQSVWSGLNHTLPGFHLNRG